jgi:hypothetical protein
MDFHAAAWTFTNMSMIYEKENDEGGRTRRWTSEGCNIAPRDSGLQHCLAHAKTLAHLRFVLKRGWLPAPIHSSRSPAGDGQRA